MFNLPDDVNARMIVEQIYHIQQHWGYNIPVDHEDEFWQAPFQPKDVIMTST